MLFLERPFDSWCFDLVLEDVRRDVPCLRLYRLSGYASLQSLHQVDHFGLFFLRRSDFFALLLGFDRLLHLLAIAILVLAEIEFALVPFADEFLGKAELTRRGMGPGEFFLISAGFLISAS